MRRLVKDFSVDLSDEPVLQNLLVSNPIDAFDQRSRHGWRAILRLLIGLAPLPSRSTLPNRRISACSFERFSTGGWRSIWHVLVPPTGPRMLSFEYRSTGGNPILFPPSTGTGGSLSEGSLEIEVNGWSMEAVVAKIAINVVREPGEAANQFPGIVRSWFGDDAGLPGRGERVRLRRNGNVGVVELLGPHALRHPASSSGSAITETPSRRRSD